jgi:hypothetical protein
MALLSGGGNAYTLSAASGVGLHNREDLQDFITNIAPTETPFLSGIGQVDAKAVVHEWLHHTLRAASNTTVATTGSVVVEGNEAALTTPTVLTRVVNQTQINSISVGISGTQDKVNKAGMGRELAYRVLLHTKEIKRDMEYAALQNTAGLTGATNVARTITGIAGFVTTNTTTTSATVTQAFLNSELQDVWTAGGNPDTLICGGAMKRKISALTSGVTKNLDANDRRLTTAVDVYESDFSIQRVIPDRFDTTTSVKIIESDLWKMAVLRPMQITPLGKSGDSDKRLLVCEWTLESRQEAGNAILTATG